MRISDWSSDVCSSDLAEQIAQAATPAAEKVVAVEAERVTVDTVLDDIRAVGTLGPDEAVVIAPEIAGRIDRINFAEGDEVDAGDVLVELDATILRAELVKIGRASCRERVCPSV